MASGSGWNLWVWLLGVVIRRYKDFLILLIPTPLVSVLFYSSIPTFCSFFKCFCSFIHSLLEVFRFEGIKKKFIRVPFTVSCAVAVDVLLLVTMHWYCPPSLPVTVRVWVYCAVTALLNTVIPPRTVLESLVQVTVVAGPPVEVQVRVN